MSTTASALFSCSVTHAVLESAETATYSGSKSWAAVALGPKIRTELPRSRSLNTAKSAVATLSCVTFSTPPATSIIEIEPSGSTSYSALGSPSLAVNTLLPSGLKVIISGRAPTSTDAINSPSVLKKTARPLACLSSFSMAATSTPSYTSTLLAIAPYGVTSICDISVGAVGTLMSIMSMVASAALTLNARWVAGSYATISEAPPSKTPVAYVPSGVNVISPSAPCCVGFMAPAGKISMGAEPAWTAPRLASSSKARA